MALPLMSTIRATTKTALDAVPAIGIVHDRPRRPQNLQPEEFDTLYIDPVIGTVRVWMVNVINNDPTEDEAGDLFITPRTVSVEGYLTFDQENDSQTTFEDLLDLATDAIAGAAAIFGTPINTPRDIIETIDFESLGDILCHHVLMTYQVEATFTAP